MYDLHAVHRYKMHDLHAVYKMHDVHAVHRYKMHDLHAVHQLLVSSICTLCIAQQFDIQHIVTDTSPPPP